MERLRYLDSLIRKKATGNPKSLAKKLNLSRSQTMAFLHELKGHGFPIEYSRRLMSYYYSEEIHLSHQLFSLKEDTPEKKASFQQKS